MTFWLVLFGVLAVVGLWITARLRRGGSRCAVCAAWDLAGGQADIDQHPVFKQAALMIPPSAMGAQVDEEGNRQETGVPESCSWTEFGRCNTHRELRWANDSCPKFKRANLSTIRKNRASADMLTRRAHMGAHL